MGHLVVGILYGAIALVGLVVGVGTFMESTGKTKRRRGR